MVRITVNGQDVEARAGASVADLRRCAPEVDIDLPRRLWCGGLALDDDHRVGAWPLVTGARLTAKPQRNPFVCTGDRLVVLAGVDAGASAPISSATLSIGRDDAADLSIADPALSRRHVVVAGSSPKAKDVGSRNGSYLWSGSRRRSLVRARTISPGAVVEMGGTLLRRLPEPPPSNTSAANRGLSFAPMAGAMVG